MFAATDVKNLADFIDWFMENIKTQDFIIVIGAVTLLLVVWLALIYGLFRLIVLLIRAIWATPRTIARSTRVLFYRPRHRV